MHMQHTHNMKTHLRAAAQPRHSPHRSATLAPSLPHPSTLMHTMHKRAYRLLAHIHHARALDLLPERPD